MPVHHVACSNAGRFNQRVNPEIKFAARWLLLLTKRSAAHAGPAAAGRLQFPPRPQRAVAVALLAQRANRFPLPGARRNAAAMKAVVARQLHYGTCSLILGRGHLLLADRAEPVARVGNWRLVAAESFHTRLHDPPLS